MNIYAKLAAAREQFHAMNLKKSGQNKFAGYSYFELADFVVPGLKVMKDNGLCPVVSFLPDHAVMVIHEIDEAATAVGGAITITCPNSEANLKGCHPIQNAGAVQTYQRRYLWMAALEIVEHDAVDSAPPVERVIESPDTGTLAELERLADGNTSRVKWLKAQLAKGMTEAAAQHVINEWKKREEAAA